jgi:hypothetical protein
MKIKKYLPMTATNDQIKAAYDAGFVVVFVTVKSKPVYAYPQTEADSCSCHDCVQFGFSAHPTQGRES